MRLVLCLLAVCLAMPAWADDRAVLARLDEPRTHALMRHALAPGSGEPEGFDLSVCATQRNLSEDGRRQARRAGDMLREAGVTPAQIWTSLYCRCVDTAREMDLGAVTRKSDLNFFGQDKGSNRRRNAAVRAALAAVQPEETVLVVGHSANLEDLTGTRPLSGEIQVVRVAETGEITLLGRVKVPVY